MLGFTTLELNVTYNCNFTCKYCTQPKERKSFSVDLDKLYNFIKEVRDPEKTFTISFWGGEPLLERDLLVKIMKQYFNDEKVSFFIYTNGSLLDNEFLDFCEQLCKKFENKSKVTIQISFDGIKVHQEYSNQLGKVLERIIETDKRFLTLKLKSTLPVSMFKYYDDVFLSYQALSYILGRDVHLGTTVDYQNEIFTVSDEQFNLYLEDLRKNLLFLLKNFSYNELKNSNFFTRNMSICGAGVKYFTMDINGDIYPCHGCLYTNELDFYVGNINDSNILERIQNHQKLMEDYQQKSRWECSNCKTNICYRCHVYVYKLNKNRLENYSFVEKWNSKNFYRLCKIYNMISSITIPFQEKHRLESLYKGSKKLLEASEILSGVHPKKSRASLIMSKELVDECDSILKTIDEIPNTIREQIQKVPKVDTRRLINQYVNKIYELVGER